MSIWQRVVIICGAYAVGKGRLGEGETYESRKGLIVHRGGECQICNVKLLNLVILQQIADLGGDSVPDRVERRVEDSMDGLGREMRVSALGDGQGIFEEIRAAEEFRRVGKDTVIHNR